MSHRLGLDHALVVEMAAKLIDEEGLEQLSLGHLAERLGIRTPSLYNHVSGLPGLKRDLALYCSRDLLDHFIYAIIGKSGDEAIFAFADTYRAYARETPGRYTLTLAAPAPDDLELVAVAQKIIEIIQAVLEPYRLSAEDNIHAIRSLRSIVHGFISLEVAGGFRMPVDLDQSFHWLIDLFISGLQ
jgi:AcrR family transcriptional regulator